MSEARESRQMAIVLGDAGYYYSIVYPSPWHSRNKRTFVFKGHEIYQMMVNILTTTLLVPKIPHIT